jgi:acetylornithine aminotransferase
MHGSTFGGNPLATATANAVLAEIESAGLIQNAAARGAEIARSIREIDSPHVAEVRGRGLLIGVGLSSPIAAAVSAAALEAGLIVNAANDSSIRIAPPLIVGDDEVRLFAERFREALDAVPSA